MRCAAALVALSLSRGAVSASSPDLPGLSLPEPPGCHAIGVRTIVVSDGRRRRELPVTIWYPASAAGDRPAAPYMDARTAEAVAAALDLVPNFLPSVRTHSIAGASLAAGGPFPVVLLEHGSGSVPALYSILAEALASSGFVVAATNHPGAALISIFPGGREVRFRPYAPAGADELQEAEAMGKFARDVLAADVEFVLDQLALLDRRDGFWRGRLDLARVGIAGHSLGGTVGAIVAARDPRISAAVNIDGPLLPGMTPAGPIEVGKPFLFLMTEEHANGPSRGREFAGSRSNTYDVEVEGAEHRSFTDSELIRSRFSRAPAGGGADSRRATRTGALTDSLVVEFFDKYLRGGNAPRLDLTVSVERK